MSVSITGDVATAITAFSALAGVIGNLLLQFRTLRIAAKGAASSLANSAKLDETKANTALAIAATADAAQATLDATAAQTQVLQKSVGEAKALSALNADAMATVAAKVDGVAVKVDSVHEGLQRVTGVV